MLNELPILVIGAGAAGISAAARLILAGIQNIIILEAKNRVGGRVHTVDFGDNVVDLGAQWVHGEKGNIVFDLAAEHKLLDSSRNLNDLNKWIFATPTGQIIPVNESSKVLGIYHDIMENMYENETIESNESQGGFFSKQYYKILENDSFIDHTRAEQFLDWIHKFDNSINAADSWSEVSATKLPEYWHCEGDPVLNWKDNGYKTVFKLLLKEIPDPTKVLPVMEKIQFNKIVTSIDYNSPNEVNVTTRDDTKYKASHVIFTASLGVLKEKHEQLFVPPLPEIKQRAIKDLGISAVNKIFLEFSHRWWRGDTSGFCILWPKEDKIEFLKTHGEDKRWLCDVFKFFTVDYQPRLLAAWISGPNAKHIETLSDSEILDGLYTLMETVLGKNYNVTRPDRMLRSGWHTDEHFRGSYSFQTLASEKSNVSAADLAKPITDSEGKPIILFAGEATHDHYYSTVHGAVESGFREADRLIDHYRIHDWLKQSVIKNAHERREGKRLETRLVIVGAGIAGLAAAKLLEDENFEDYVLVEAQENVGGRINSVTWNKCYLEYGAQFLHGDKSKLAEICNQYQLLSNVYSRDGDGTFFRENGQKVDENVVRDVDDLIRDALEECEDDEKAQEYHNMFGSIGGYLRASLENHLQERSTNSTEEEVKREIFDWNDRFLKIDNSISTLDELSIKSWGKFKFVGGPEHLSFKSGYSSVVKCIAEGLNPKNLRLNTVVERIKWHQKIEDKKKTRSLLITLSDGSQIEADCAIVTCPLGYLKENHKRMFEPPLPSNLSTAIDNLGFGLINKIFLDFETPWWNSTVKGFQFLWSNKEFEESNKESQTKRIARSLASWTRDLTGFDVLPGHRAVLLGWIGGRSAYCIETLSEQQIIDDCCELFRYFLKDDAIPPAKRCRRTQWYSNKYTRGSYSHIPTTCDNKEISPATLTTPVWGTVLHENRYKDVPLILLAGEATHDTFFSTTHGAYDTGVKQAQTFLQYHVNTI